MEKELGSNERHTMRNAEAPWKTFIHDPDSFQGLSKFFQVVRKV